jgi:hypothetical protein
MAAIPEDAEIVGSLGSKSHGKPAVLASPALSAADVKHVFQVTAKNGFLPLLAPLRKLPHEYSELEDVRSVYACTHIRTRIIIAFYSCYHPHNTNVLVL